MPLDQTLYATTTYANLKSINVAQEEWQNYLLTLQTTSVIQQKAMDMYAPQQPCHCPQCKPFHGLKDDPGVGDGERKLKAMRLLQEARSRLALPDVWTQGSDRITARDVPGGYKFCARGVMVYLAVTHGYDLGTVKQAFRSLAHEIPAVHHLHGEPQGIIAHYNDTATTTRSDVLITFDRAIQRIEAEQLKPAMA